MQSGNVKIVNKLILSGANVDTMDGKDGNSTMHRAAELGKIEIIKLLIENKADINFANKLQATPLDYAIDQSAEVTNLLRKHGAKTGEELKAEGK